MVNFIAQLRPDIAIWYHQDLYVISPGRGARRPDPGALRRAHRAADGRHHRRHLHRHRRHVGTQRARRRRLGGLHRRARRRRSSPEEATMHAERRAHDRRRGLTRSISAEAGSRRRAAAVAVAGEHAPAVPLGDVAHDRQSQARPRHRPRLVGAMEAVEHERQLVLGDARSHDRRRRCPVARRVTSIGPSPTDRTCVALSSRHDSARCTAARWATTGSARRRPRSRARSGARSAPRRRVASSARSSCSRGSSTTSPTATRDDLVDELGQLLDLGVDVVHAPPRDRRR